MDILLTFVCMLAGIVASGMEAREPAVRAMERVFVYGSLQKGEPNHHHLVDKGEAAVFRGIGKTSERYPLVIASRYNIPFLLDAPGKGMNVLGELYDVDEATLRQLDALERHPEYYTRSKISTILNGTESQTWAYLLHDYKPFMATLPYLESYSSLGPHGLKFVPGKNRTAAHHYITEVKLGTNDIAIPKDSASFDVGPRNERRHLVFVYGTLKRRERNYVQMTDVNNGWAQLMALANTQDAFPLVIATQYNIPFLLDSQGDGQLVDGEVYAVDDQMLSHLDDFEDVPEFYKRETINVFSKNTEESMLAWTYLLHDFKRDLLKKPLLTSYSTEGPHGLMYQEPAEITGDAFKALLAAVKSDQPT